MKEWYEVEVKGDWGWARLCAPPLSIHGGLVDPEVRRFPTVIAAGRARSEAYPDYPTRVIRCHEDGTEELA